MTEKKVRVGMSAKGKIRLGMSARGKVVHIVIGRNNQALCEKKQIKLIVNPKLTLDDVTCKRCMQTGAFKEGMDNMIFKSTKISKPTPAPTPEPELASTPKEPILGIPKTQLEPEPDSDDTFFSKQMKDDSFKIVHKPTNKVFFSQIEEEVIKKAITLLNELSITWASIHDKLPPKFISKCREAVALAYDQANVTLPITLKASKKEKRAIKRRDKKTKDKKAKDKKSNVSEATKGSRATKIFNFIFDEMQEEIALNDLATKIATEFKLTQKRGMGNIKKSIRRMRKKNIVIAIKTRPNKADDLYMIDEDD